MLVIVNENNEYHENIENEMRAEAENADKENDKENTDKFLDLAQKVLLIERSWWKIAPTRAEAIRKVLDFSESRYYLILGTLLDSYDFWKLDPPLVGRLKALRDGRLEERQTYAESK